jgi:hypothetical protein
MSHTNPNDPTCTKSTITGTCPCCQSSDFIDRDTIDGIETYCNDCGNTIEVAS